MLPLGGQSWLHYGYDQRNLMISHTLSISGTAPQLQGTSSYDGRSNRTQQVDYSGVTSITTSYTNDIMGLAQVLVADNGTIQTHMLYGLDLISQDDGNVTRYLLVDALGSVRIEMVDEDIETATTYAPFGNLLQQTGPSGTVYAFTGEQYDSSTEQLYLRARYYNPALHTFMSKDPWSGHQGNPQSMNGWSYVENNPVKLIDPTGRFPEHCKRAIDGHSYAACVRRFYEIRRPGPGPSIDFGLNWYNLDMTYPFQGEPGCFYGPIPYRAPGYVEGFSFVIPPSVFLGITVGTEMVYDFATMERNGFEYIGGVLQDSAGTGLTQYIGKIQGFRSWPGNNLTSDYEGWFSFNSFGVGVGLVAGAEIGPGVGGGFVLFRGVPDFTIHGHAWYFGASFGFDALPIGDIGTGYTYYTYPQKLDHVLNDINGGK